MKPETQNVRLNTIVERIGSGDIKLPAFQRGFVWEPDQILRLLDSIYQGFPIGALLLWRTDEHLDAERNIGGFELPETSTGYPVNYLLDGQQRLTSLYAAFRPHDEATQAEESEIFNVAFLPESKEFVPAAEAPGESINLDRVLNMPRLMVELGRFNDANKRTIVELQEVFKDYEIPVVTIAEKDHREVCDIFERINSQGTPLTTMELLTAWTWSESFDLRESLIALQSEIEEAGFGQIENRTLLQCLSAMNIGQITTQSIVDVEPKDIVESIPSLQQGLRGAVDFLAQEISIGSLDFLPFPVQLIPLVWFFSREPRPNAKQLRGLKRWFWRSSFTLRYAQGTNRNAAADIETMNKLLKGADDAFTSLPADVQPAFFSRTWAIRSAAAKAHACLLAQQDPRSLLSGTQLDLNEVLSRYNAREFHHLFPRAFLRDLGIEAKQANILANICMVTAPDNKVIGRKAPEEYFGQIPGDERQDILARALISDDPELLKNYEDFTVDRAERLAAAATALASV